MSVYAEIVNGVVVNIIEADANFVESQTNKNYILCTRAGVGWTFNGTDFIRPQPYPSWVLDENNNWQSPIPMPMDGKKYEWFEPNQVWIALV